MLKCEDGQCPLWYLYKNSSTDLQFTVTHWGFRTQLSHFCASRAYYVSYFLCNFDWCCYWRRNSPSNLKTSVWSSCSQQRALVRKHSPAADTLIHRSPWRYETQNMTDLLWMKRLFFMFSEASCHLRLIEPQQWIRSRSTAVCSYRRGFLFSSSSACLVADLWPHGRSNHWRSGSDESHR